MFLSAITIGELTRGVERLPESRRKQMLRDWLENQLTERFAGRILSLDIRVMRRWGSLVADLERTGRTQALMDSLIAAAALQWNLTLVTRNVDDFRATDVSLFNPWT